MNLRAGPLRRLPSALVLLFLAPATGADVLVLRDGTRLETRGPWQEKGRRLVFTSSAGALSAIRADEVDLAASAAATAKASETVPAQAPRAPDDRPVILTLDANDLGLGEDPDLSFEEGPRQVVMYGAAWCGVCRRTQEMFDSIGLVYTYLDVDADAAARAERDRRSGGRQVVPVVDWGGEIIIGFRGARFLELAKEDAEAAAARQRAAEAKEREQLAEARREAAGDPDSGADEFADQPVDADDSEGSAAPGNDDAEPPRRRATQPVYGS